jgi:hypothetical protein
MPKSLNAANPQTRTLPINPLDDAPSLRNWRRESTSTGHLLNSLPRSLIKHQRVFGVVYRPRLEATKEALTQKQTALDGRDAAIHVLNDFAADF